MNVVSVCPLRVASLEWRTSRGVAVLTVIAKATYRLLPVTCALAEDQDEPSEFEAHWGYDLDKSVHAPSDLVPYKPRPEVTLVGQAFAPRGEAVTRLVARLVVGNVDKSIAVHADRSFSQDGTLRHGPRFARMPIRWEKAAAGPETWNPVGVTRSPDTFGVVRLPNLEPPDTNVTRSDDFIEPVSFGPIAADWPARRMRLGRHAGLWSPSAIQTAPLPEGLDPLYFLSAPADQLLDELRANERLILENLHPDHPRLATSLPGHEPRAFVERAGAAPTELAMVCDTLWIDTDRAVCTLTWRGQLTLDASAQEGRVVVGMATQGQALSWSAVEEAARAPRDSLEDTRPRPSGRRGSRSRHTAVHDAGPLIQSWPTWLAGKGDEAGEPPPARPGGVAETARPPGDVRLADLAAQGTGTMDVAVPKQVIEAAIARAEADRQRPPPAVPPAPAPVPLGLAGLAGGSLQTPPAPEMASSWLRAPTPSSPPPPVSAWAAGSSATAPRPTYSEVPPPLRVPEAPAVASVTAGTLGETPRSPPTGVLLRQATERGAAAASNAAAAAATPVSAPRERSAGAPSPAREPPREHVDLLWFDPTAVPRILADKVLGEARAEPEVTRWVKEVPAQREPQEVKDRREILAVVSRGRPVEEPAGLEQVAAVAYRDDGTFTAPLVLVAGDLIFDFDEVETLRAVLTVTAPFLGADKKLREVASAAADALKTEGRLPGHIAVGLTSRVEEAFAQGQRSVAPDYLDNSVERILLEDRRYPRKTLFGEPRLRSLFAFAGTAAPVPTYLPEALSTRLPLFRRFRVRAIVELRPQEDQYETHPDALLVLALGRVIRRSTTAGPERSPQAPPARSGSA